MSDDIFLPEQGERSEYLPLLDLMWLDQEKILIRVKINPLLITVLQYRIITLLPSWGIRSIHEYGIDPMCFYEFHHYLFWSSSIYRESSTMLREITIDRLERFTDESESWIMLTEILDRSDIMDKYRKYFFRRLHRFDESRIIMSAEILTEDEE